MKAALAATACSWPLMVSVLPAPIDCATPVKFRSTETGAAAWAKLRVFCKPGPANSTSLLLPLPGAVLVAFLHKARRLSSLTVLPEVLRLSATLYLVVLLVLLIGLGVALKMRRRSSD